MRAHGAEIVTKGLPEMKVGCLVPHGVPGVEVDTLEQWCRGIDEGPFSSLGVADRLVYPNLEPMQVLAFAAALTSRVRLLTAAVIPPLRGAALFAKQAATAASLAGPNRLSLGVVAGARQYDYDGAGVPWSGRCNAVTAALEVLAAAREPADDQALGPQPPEFEILIGGARRFGLEWQVRFGDGYISGGIKPEFFNYEVMATREAWERAGKPGSPRIVASTWVASDERYDETVANVGHYLAKGGPPEPIKDRIWRGESGFMEAVETFGQLGAEEFVVFPHVTDLRELDWLTGMAAKLSEPARV